MLSSSALARFAPSRWSIAAAIIILAGTGYLKWNAGLMPAPVSIPNPTPPSPNARDIYDRAELLLRDADSTNPLPQRTSKDDTKLTSVAQLAKDRRLVAENLPALALLRQGLQAECLEPAVRSISTLEPYYAKDRAVTRLLTLEGQLKARDGNWSGAIEDEIDAIQFGVSLQHGATLIGCLVGLACEQSGRRQVWGGVAHLNASQAEAAETRMASISSTAVPFSSVLQEEQRCGQASMLEINRKHLLNSTSYSELAGDSYTFSQNIAFHLESPRFAYDTYTKRMDEAIRRSNLPWPEQRALKPQALPTDPVNSILFPIFTGAGTEQRDGEALNKMLEVELAIQAYHLEFHGAYPTALKQLVPAYLPAVPIDPFSDRQPLRYRLVGGRPQLYSIGPDAIDNSGQPYVNKSPNYSYAQEDATGDIIAGDASKHS